MNVQQLRYFLAVVEHGSFSAAAESLRLAPPSVSEPIRRLEAELGLALFERDKRSLRPTDSGVALIPRARQVIRALNDAGEAMGELKALRGGVATLGLFRNADYYEVTSIAADFRRQHPGMTLRMVGQNSAEVADAIRSGMIEAGLVVLPISDDELSITPLLRDEVLYASADRAHTRVPIDLSTLVQRDLILYDAHYGNEDPTRHQVVARVQENGLKLDPVLEVERVETALRLVERGLADTFASGSVLDTLAPKLHRVSLEPQLFDTVAVVTRRAARLSPASVALIQLADQKLRAVARRSSTISLVQVDNRVQQHAVAERESS